MASQYQPRQFFRQVPNDLLARYFEVKGISLGLDPRELPRETGIEPLFEAFVAVPDEQVRSKIELEFQEIQALASEGGIGALHNEAAFCRDEAFSGELAAADGFHAKAMLAFLIRPDYWRAATRLLHADNVAARFWKKRSDLQAAKPRTDPEAIHALEQAICDYFSQREDRGRNCQVEVYRKVEKDREYFFAYPEDYGQSDLEWGKQGLDARARHPAFEIIFAYSQAEGSLDIYAPRNTKAVAELQRIFARTILGMNRLPGDHSAKPVYDLDPLADPDFEFQIPDGSGIEKVVVTRMRLTLKRNRNPRIVLEANTNGHPKAVYDILKHLDVPDYFVTQVGVKVEFETEPGKRRSTKNFTVTHPSYCNLHYDGKDAILRQMLIDSGLDPIASVRAPERRGP